jgi:hypothetical protein
MAIPWPNGSGMFARPPDTTPNTSTKQKKLHMCRSKISGWTITVLLILALTQETLAQKNSMADTLPPRPYWEIATDLLWLIDKQTVPQSSIFIRRNRPEADGGNTALRLRVGLEATHEKRLVINTDIPSDSFFVYQPYLSIGYQKGRSFGRWGYFYGLDLVGSGYQKRQELLVVNGSGYELFKRNVWQYNVGGDLFCGFNWRLSKGLSISLENHIGYAFSRYRFKDENGPVGGPPYGFADDRVKRHSLIIKPIHVVNLSYSFIKKNSHEKK